MQVQEESMLLDSLRREMEGEDSLLSREVVEDDMKEAMHRK